VVRVLDHRGKFLGTAHYSSTSQITLRMLSDKAEMLERSFFEKRITAALEHRKRVVQNADACRLVFSEGDLLPGLIVDRYGAYLTMQTLNQGMDRARDCRWRWSRSRVRFRSGCTSR
jgi:23S rRNA (cytosine1962-C5)-methyltransferase